MRVLRFTNDAAGQAHFRVIIQVVGSADGQGREQVRRLNKMQDKFEAVGKSELKTRRDPASGEDVDVTSWRLQEGGGEVWLEDAEFAELRGRMDDIRWPPGFRKIAAAAWDMLDAAPEEDPRKHKLPAELTDVDR